PSVLDPNPEHRDRIDGHAADGLSGPDVERARVVRTYERPFVVVDVSVGERRAVLGTLVADGVRLSLELDDGEADPGKLVPADLAFRDLRERSDAAVFLTHARHLPASPREASSAGSGPRSCPGAAIGLRQPVPRRPHPLPDRHASEH